MLSVRWGAVVGRILVARNWTSMLIVGTVITCAFGGFVPGIPASLASAHATKPLPRVTVTGRVLLGDDRSFRTVGVVDRRAIFDALPSIRMLKVERVPRDSARYHFLVYEANRRFQRAIERASVASQVDLIVEAGGVSAAGIEVRDLTDLTRSFVGRDR